MAGNIVDDLLLGSVEFAVVEFGSQVAAGRLRVVGARYDLDNGRVSLVH